MRKDSGLLHEGPKYVGSPRCPLDLWVRGVCPIAVSSDQLDQEAQGWERSRGASEVLNAIRDEAGGCSTFKKGPVREGVQCSGEAGGTGQSRKL